MRFVTVIIIAWTTVCIFGIVAALKFDVPDVALMWGQMLVAYWGGLLTMLGKGGE